MKFTTWMKLDLDFYQNHKVMQAGRDGALLYQLILVVNTRNGRNGILLASEADPRFLSSISGVLNLTEDLIKVSLEACIRAKLLRRSRSGGLSIVGWDASWMPPSSGQERTEKWREKAGKPGKSARSARDVSVTTPPSHAVTVCDASEKRREEKRSTVPTTPTPPPGGGGYEQARSEPEEIPERNRIAALTSTMREAGMVDEQAIGRGVEALAGFTNPPATLACVVAHSRRFGRDPSSLMAWVLGNRQRVEATLARSFAESNDQERAKALSAQLGELATKATIDYQPARPKRTAAQLAARAAAIAREAL